MKPKAFLCDVWGVIHNGVKLYDDVLPFAEYCKKNDIKCDALEYYVNNRDEVIKSIMNTYQLEKGDVKQLFLRLNTTEVEDLRQKNERISSELRVANSKINE